LKNRGCPDVTLGAWISRKMRENHAPAEAAPGLHCGFPGFFAENENGTADASSLDSPKF
jgi:hypothetical protein